MHIVPKSSKLSGLQCPIYTANNWNMLNYLYKGILRGNTMIVYLDATSPDYTLRFNKLRRISPYLAGLIESYAPNGGVVFIKQF